MTYLGNNNLFLYGNLKFYKQKNDEQAPVYIKKEYSKLFSLASSYPTRQRLETEKPEYSLVVLSQ